MIGMEKKNLFNLNSSYMITVEDINSYSDYKIKFMKSEKSKLMAIHRLLNSKDTNLIEVYNELIRREVKSNYDSVIGLKASNDRHIFLTTLRDFVSGNKNPKEILNFIGEISYNLKESVHVNIKPITLNIIKLSDFNIYYAVERLFQLGFINFNIIDTGIQVTEINRLYQEYEHVNIYKGRDKIDTDYSLVFCSYDISDIPKKYKNYLDKEVVYYNPQKGTLRGSKNIINLKEREVNLNDLNNQFISERG